MQIHIIRHLEELACPAGITPQGFRNRHSPSTMFRTAKESRLYFNCPTKACCLCFVFTCRVSNEFLFFGPFRMINNTYRDSKAAKVLRPALGSSVIRIRTSSFRANGIIWPISPIIASHYSNWMNMVPSHRPHMKLHRSDRRAEVSLPDSKESNRAVTGRRCSTVTVRAALFFITNRLVVCAF